MLTQLRNESIFTIQNQFRKEQRENKKENIDIFKDIVKSFDYMETEVTATIYTDQDGNEHLIFVRKGKEKDKQFLHEFYNSLYLSGNQCRDISDLVCQKRCLKCSSSEEGFENAEVSFLTAISVLKCVTFMKDVSLMSAFCYWLYSIKR